MYDYDAREADELTVAEGDILRVLKEDYDWLVCELDGKKGSVPRTYVEFLQKKLAGAEDESSSSESATESSSGDGGGSGGSDSSGWM